MSDFLFARPSFWSGIARTLDMWGVFDEYNSSPLGSLADYRALRSDWRAVGDDLTSAIKAFEKAHPDVSRGRRPSLKS